MALSVVTPPATCKRGDKDYGRGVIARDKRRGTQMKRYVILSAAKNLEIAATSKILRFVQDDACRPPSAFIRVHLWLISLIPRLYTNSAIGLAPSGRRN